MERPILLNGAEVRALLDGTKTQTRRVVKANVKGCTVGTYTSGGVVEPVNVQADGDPWDTIPCPYGVPGDRLWVRETWRPVSRGRPETYDTAAPLDLDPRKAPNVEYGAVYRADDVVLWHSRCHVSVPHEASPLHLRDAETVRWRPSTHMPRGASRITLEVTNVRVERVQDISEEDAIAEGFIWEEICAGGFRRIWDSINAKRGYDWEANPWVWCVTLRMAS